ncbi:MAG: endonuclease [Flavobacteriaceae bacterium]|jgi:endonuclease I|nr:endonuclease [Flavobacteriaceae bacterium]
MKKYVILLATACVLLTTSCSSDSAVPLPTEKPNPGPGPGPGPGPNPEPEPEPEPEPNDDYVIPSDQKEYYKSIDFKKSGIELKKQLTKLITNTHTQVLGYNNNLWEALKITDVTPDGKNVYLLYGHPNQTQGTQTYTREKNNHGGGIGQWNREHTYARSKGTPNLEKSPAPNSDMHHIRPADVTWNEERGNEKFAASKGSTLSGPVAGGWYPGDEWKGDVARMMMYMYVRYESQCLPTNIAVGTTNNIDPQMINLLLDWNAEDPVSEIEKKRNDYHGNTKNEYAQGNRNPFIDNPQLANKIWGGKAAANHWKK